MVGFYFIWSELYVFHITTKTLCFFNNFKLSKDTLELKGPCYTNFQRRQRLVRKETIM
jgi:hypothetical protein